MRFFSLCSSASLAAVLFTCLFAATGLQAKEQVTLESLLQEMVDRDRVASWPEPEYRAALAGSYDRASKTPDDPKGWFANQDNSDGIAASLSCITNNDRREWILVDVNGPGCITRFWTGGKPAVGNVRFYLDGSKEPAITAPMQDLFCGRGFVPRPLAIENSGNAGNLYLPVPYASHCTITYDEPNHSKPGAPPPQRWWNTEYRTYPAGTKVKAFSMDDFKALEPLISKTCKTLLEPPVVAEGKAASFDKTIEPGKDMSLDLPRGAAAVRSMEMHFSAAQPDLVGQALRSSVLRMDCDGIETIWCPVGDFFGCGPCLCAVSSWNRTAGVDGTLTCRWVMPYRKSAKVTMMNLGANPVTVKLNVVTGKWKWNNQSMYFHSNWRQQREIPTRPLLDWNYVTVTGKGVYMGDTLSLFNPTTGWWGEGDEKVWVDDKTFPTHFGTGSEDCYGYAWGNPTPFQGPFCNQPMAHPKNVRDTVVTRTRSLDAIPFAKSLKFDMEIWHWVNCKMDYAVATYWYALPGATCNRVPEPEESKAPIRGIPGFLRDATECETMKVLTSSEDLKISTQENYPFANGEWSGSAQMFVQARKEGDLVELLVADKVDGPKKLVCHATKSYDYGILRFTVNGKSAKSEFDGYAEKPELSGPIELGVFEPKDGKIMLRAEVTGANPASRNSKYFFGLDCIVLSKP